MLDLCFCASQSRTKLWEQDVSVFRCLWCSNQNFLRLLQSSWWAQGAAEQLFGWQKFFRKLKPPGLWCCFQVNFANRLILQKSWMLPSPEPEVATGQPHICHQGWSCRCSPGWVMKHQQRLNGRSIEAEEQWNQNYLFHKHSLNKQQNWGTKTWCFASQCVLFCAVRTGTELALAI